MTKRDLVLLITPLIKQFVELNDLDNCEVKLMFRVQDNNLVFVTIAEEEKIKVS